jgi:hypothetical protein
MTDVLERPAASAVPRRPPGRKRVAPITRAEVLIAAAAGVVLSLVMNWPLPARLGSHIGEDLGDPVRTAWQIAWEGHALLHHPAQLYQANAFWPLRDSFAFSDSLLGYMPAALVGNGAHAALVRYNLLFLFTYALCFFGAYLLARELGVRRLAAVVAGVAFAYAPFRLTMNGHLHVISSGGVPLALFLLLRGYRRRSWKWIAAGWAVAAWQLSLGFTNGLQLGYLLVALAALCAVVWWRRGRPALGRPVVIATVAGALLFGAVGGFQARPVLKVSHDYPQAKRSNYEVSRYSAPPKAFLSAPREDRVWGAVTKPIRKTLVSQNEQDQFPGLTIFALALLGVAAGGVYTRRLRASLAVAVVALAIFSLGLGVLDGDVTWRLVQRLPGWDGVRTPGRLIMLTSLGLALLAAAGADRLIGAAELRAHGPRLRLVLPLAAAGLLALGVLAEGRGSMPNPAVPGVPAAVAAARAPQMDLPTNSAYDRIYQYWSSEHFNPVANGVATFSIPAQDALRDWMNEFPNAHSVSLLRHLGVRTVFLHLDVERLPIPRKDIFPYPADARSAARRSIRGLPITRVVRTPRLIEYDLAPLPVTRAEALRYFAGIHV